MRGERRRANLQALWGCPGDHHKVADREWATGHGHALAGIGLSRDNRHGLGGRVAQAAVDQLLVGVIASHKRTEAGGRLVVAMPNVAAQRIATGVQGVVAEGEAVVAPDGVVPVFERRRVAGAGDRAKVWGAVPLIGEDAHALRDVEQRMRTDDRLAGGRHAEFKRGRGRCVAHAARNLADAVAAVSR